MKPHPHHSVFADYAHSILNSPDPTASLVAVLRLTMAKCIRGVADAAPVLQSPALKRIEDANAVEIVGYVIDQASIGHACITFARDCEAGECSADDLVAAMFVHAADQVLRARRDSDERADAVLADFKRKGER